ncbi:hypothetical protein, partial [Mesorhizobium sp.]|uniref:hypothetical protein n=1 Tax=Mesorhizobium sp. TaxID=1871066 RepID=UPI0025C5861A
REEPGAGNPPARICEGESRMAELLDHDPTVDTAPFGLTVRRMIDSTAVLRNFNLKYGLLLHIRALPRSTASLAKSELCNAKRGARHHENPRRIWVGAKYRDYLATKSVTCL